MVILHYDLFVQWYMFKVGNSFKVYLCFVMIYFVQPSPKGGSSARYLRADWVWDSLKQKKQLPIEKYLLSWSYLINTVGVSILYIYIVQNRDFLIIILLWRGRDVYRFYLVWIELLWWYSQKVLVHCTI